MKLNWKGEIALEQWQKLPERFENIEAKEFVVMPNHTHGTLFTIESDGVGAGFTPARERSATAGHPRGVPLRKTIGDVVGAYKSLVANECLKRHKAMNQTIGKMWQRNYYEHIIRDEESYVRIAEYILNNPLKWAEDDLYVG